MIFHISDYYNMLKVFIPIDIFITIIKTIPYKFLSKLGVRNFNVPISREFTILYFFFFFY